MLFGLYFSALFAQFYHSYFSDFIPVRLKEKEEDNGSA
jgi:hypothetical protein